jgi:gliding motility-associated lipoprotein GldD
MKFFKLTLFQIFKLFSQKHKFCLTLWIVLWLGACSRDYSPKPSAYFYIDFPETVYRSIGSSDSDVLFEKHFPFEFEISNQAIIGNVGDSTQTRWFSIDYPCHNAHIFCSYFPVTRDDFRAKAGESRDMAYFHAIKANGIDEYEFSNPEQKVYGLVYEIKGNVATPIQFVVTDSVHSFFRGALYFDNPPNQDSIAPVLAYINKDIGIILESFQWKR